MLLDFPIAAMALKNYHVSDIRFATCLFVCRCRTHLYDDVVKHTHVMYVSRELLRVVPVHEMEF